VELGDVMRDADAGRRAFAADRFGLSHHKTVELPPDRLTERRQTVDLLIESICGHGASFRSYT
jgi:hypothetical protein